METENSKTVPTVKTEDSVERSTDEVEQSEVKSLDIKTESNSENVDDVDAEESDKTEAATGDGEIASSVKEENHSEYSYLEREGFTSEIYKIEIHNLPKYVRFGQLKKKLTALELNPKKVKLIKGNGNYFYAFVTFSCEEHRTKALNVLGEYQWKGQKLSVKKANPKADPLLLKRKLERTGDGELDAKRQKNDDLSPEEKLKLSVTPLSDMPYEEQLQKKEAEMKEVLKKFGRLINRNNRQLVPWLNQQRTRYDGLCCPMDPIKPSPILVGYRNKNEFTIGKDLAGNDTVGFRYGSYRGGSSRVGDPSPCRNVPEKAIKTAQAFREYLTTTPWPAFDPEDCSGHWRMLTVRTSQLGDIMVIVEFHPQTLPVSQINDVKNHIKHYFTKGPGKDTDMTTLYFQANGDRMSGSNMITPLELIIGKEHMFEKLLDMTFQISPNAFFQVNTPAAEVLYKTVGEWSDITPETTLLDICCGTGTIGLSMAKNVKNVFGIEMCKQAVEDAVENAKKNGVSNVEYWCRKAEDCIFDVTRNLRSNDIVAIVDPPRAGLHPKVIQTIRKCVQINKLVYVSCSPNSAMMNFEDLSRPISKRVKGAPFIPVKAVPVDLFPDTAHCEMIIVFERVTDYDKLTSAETNQMEVKESESTTEVSHDGNLERGVKESENHVETNNEQLSTTVGADPVEPADCSDAVEPADCSDAVEPADCSDPVEPADCSDAVEPANCSDAVEPAIGSDAAT
ncbi:tRNA (uracil-5-)-methyltransferase homolog A-like [Tubulanus polymorphus]|uniref:tRNA (uracil-5-)-methyltransferase homolog A-like n=1 Tax=Tubulanus polymorphus TaxID=672921 RepID=UPI003DA368F9